MMQDVLASAIILLLTNLFMLD